MSKTTMSESLAQSQAKPISEKIEQLRLLQESSLEPLQELLREVQEWLEKEVSGLPKVLNGEVTQALTPLATAMKNLSDRLIESHQQMAELPEALNVEMIPVLEVGEQNSALSKKMDKLLEVHRGALDVASEKLAKEVLRGLKDEVTNLLAEFMPEPETQAESQELEAQEVALSLQDDPVEDQLYVRDERSQKEQKTILQRFWPTCSMMVLIGIIFFVLGWTVGPKDSSEFQSRLHQVGQELANSQSLNAKWWRMYQSLDPQIKAWADNWWQTHE